MFTNEKFTGTHDAFYGIEDLAPSIYGMTEEQYEASQTIACNTFTDDDNNVKDDSDLPFVMNDEPAVSSEHNDDPIYFEFFMANEHFTVEDYDNTYAVYHEDMFVNKLADKDDHKEAYEIARKYLFG